jgi:MFS family permease
MNSEARDNDTVSFETAERLTISPRYRRYILTILMLILVVNYVDRQIINILAEPIKRDLGLADWQVGVMSGFAFSTLYSAVGIPIALLADRTDRAKVLGGAVAFWSVMTTLCGLTANFGQLLLARVGVGLGEAGCMPPAQSFVVDITPREQRARALSIFALGLPIGSLLALSVGGMIADRAGWRIAFLLLGVPGILLAALVVFTVKEPRSLIPGYGADRVRTSFAGSMADIRRNRIFWLVTLGAAITCLVYFGFLAFIASFFFRAHGADLDGLADLLSHQTGLHIGRMGLAGVGLGILLGSCGIVGTLLGGYLGDLTGRTHSGAYLRVPAIVLPCAACFLTLALTRQSVGTAVLFLVPGLIMMNMWLGPVFATINTVVAPWNRSFAVSVHQACVTLVGTGSGPLVIGGLSDGIRRFGGVDDAAGLRLALIATSTLFVVSALVFGVVARRPTELIAGD